MKLGKIVERVAQLRDYAANGTGPVDYVHDVCLQMERALWRDVLQSDAMGKGSPAKSAAALETIDIPFPRQRSY